MKNKRRSSVQENAKLGPMKRSQLRSRIILNFTKIMTFSGQISFHVSKKFAEINLPHLRENNFKGITI